MDTSVVNNAAQSTANAAVTATSDKPPSKSTLTEGQGSKPADSTTTGIAQPLQVAPDSHKPADTPAATANGTAAAPHSTITGINGNGGKLEPLVPEVIKQADAPTTETPASATTGAPTTTGSSATSQPSVMTGANPSASEPKPTESDQDDGVKDVTAATAAAAGGGAAPVTTDKPAELNGSGNKDIDIRDAPLPAKAADVTPATASLADTSASNDTTSQTAETGEKRKADTDATNGAATAEEPAEKKQKSTVEKVVEKAKEVVEDVKEKTTGSTTTTKDNAPARKGSKRGKKDAPPVGRTERKTRSQARLE